MSASLIFDITPRGSLVAYSDGAPRPPARFTRKLAAWQRRNGTGRLVRKEPARERSTYMSPTCFTLHEGTFGQNGIILVSVMRTYGIDSDLRFRVIECPGIGQVRVLQAMATASRRKPRRRRVVAGKERPSPGPHRGGDRRRTQR